MMGFHGYGYGFAIAVSGFKYTLRKQGSSIIMAGMTENSNQKLVALATELVEAAANKGITLRVMAGVAVYMTCSGIETHPSLQRELHDLDLSAAPKDFDALAGLFSERGLRLTARDANRMAFEGDGAKIEVFAPDYRDSRRVDLGPRLAVSSPMLPLADLLLIKLQRSHFEEKDVRDSIALLLDHRVGRGEGEDQIDREYIARLGAGDWGLFTTTYDNLVKLEQELDRYLEPEEAQLVWRRIELLQEDMDRERKSLGWMVNQVLRRPTQVPR